MQVQAEMFRACRIATGDWLMRFARPLRYLLPLAVVGVYWLAMFVGTHIPSYQPPGPGGFDKIEHASAYCGLAIMLSVAVAIVWRTGAAALLAVFAIGAIYGAMDELSQLFVIGRSCDILDWFADLTGLAAGITLFSFAHWAWRSWRDRRKNLDADALPNR
jgi:VanZ family protein